MVCQHCGENPATFHYTEMTGGQHHEMHYCEACAAAQGHTQELVVPSLLASAVSAAARNPEHEDLTCPHCGITFSEFRRKGRLGCPKDYEVFAKPIEAMLRKMHDNRTRHRGRLPRGPIEVRSLVGDRLLHLRRELQEAVAGERYEAAASLRDEIRRIEQHGLEFGEAAGLQDLLEP